MDSHSMCLTVLLKQVFRDRECVHDDAQEEAYSELIPGYNIAQHDDTTNQKDKS